MVRFPLIVRKPGQVVADKLVLENRAEFVEEVLVLEDDVVLELEDAVVREMHEILGDCVVRELHKVLTIQNCVNVVILVK